MDQFKIPLLIIWDVSSILYMILNVEFSLQMNNIVDVYDMLSVGQLIPIIIGAGGIAVAAAELYVFLRQGKLKVDLGAGGKLAAEEKLAAEKKTKQGGGRGGESTLPDTKEAS